MFLAPGSHNSLTDRRRIRSCEVFAEAKPLLYLKHTTEVAVPVLFFHEIVDIQLLLIDVMMPRMDGIRATLKIREKSNIPIIILSAKTEDADKVMGLNVGADDYITKPFNSLELIARVKSQLRRYTKLGTMQVEEKQNIYQSGGLMINDDTKQVMVDGEEVRKLTPMQYNILLFLLRNKGRVFSIEQIYENIWNEDAVNVDNTVAVHIRHIREKIEINPKEPRYLKVVWGVGYKIESIPVQ